MPKRTPGGVALDHPERIPPSGPQVNTGCGAADVASRGFFRRGPRRCQQRPRRAKNSNAPQAPAVPSASSTALHQRGVVRRRSTGVGLRAKPGRQKRETSSERRQGCRSERPVERRWTTPSPLKPTPSSCLSACADSTEYAVSEACGLSHGETVSGHVSRPFLEVC